MNKIAKPEKARDVAKPEPQYIAPLVDVSETKDEFVLEADMPGVNKSGIEVLLEGNELTIVGRRPEVATPASYVHRESSGHHYRRAFVLDPGIDASKVQAEINQGVLRVHLPKAEQVKPRRVAVTVE